MKWLSKRKYNELRDSERFHRIESEGLRVSNDMLRGLLSEVYPQLTKLTFEESHEILSACVDYHRALKSLSAADPFQHRVLKIFEKYGIEEDRNTIGDAAVKRASRANAVLTGVTD